MGVYEFRHVVGFEETSLVGNVYFSNYLVWQGHCRERFLRDDAPEVLAMMARREVLFFTRSCSCDFVGEWGFSPLDDVLIHMRLERFRGGRLCLAFEYFNATRAGELVATGTQEIDCKAVHGDEWHAVPFPPPMIEALKRYADTDELQEALEDALEFQRGPGPQG